MAAIAVVVGLTLDRPLPTAGTTVRESKPATGILSDSGSDPTLDTEVITRAVVGLPGTEGGILSANIGDVFGMNRAQRPSTTGYLSREFAGVLSWSSEEDAGTDPSREGTVVDSSGIIIFTDTPNMVSNLTSASRLDWERPNEERPPPTLAQPLDSWDRRSRDFR